LKIEDELYKQIIMEHYKSPKHKEKMENPDKEQEGVNRSCGDEITIFLKLDGDIIKEATFDGVGCSISQASASILTDVITGKKISEAKDIIKKFKSMLLRGEDPHFTEEESDLEALEGVKRYPIRLKCALLSWNTLEQMLDEDKEKKKEE
jgi:nitrogen fixation protein NifU and related proteins